MVSDTKGTKAVLRITLRLVKAPVMRLLLQNEVVYLFDACPAFSLLILID